MLYRILKNIISLGIRLYYREIKVQNENLLPQKGPLIIIANHPNTIMDAWVIGMISKQPIYFMAKATLFNSKIKQKLLRGLNMIPINRKGEGKIEGVDNQDSFIECYKILEKGKTLVIFPEGNSYKEKVLRELKTGTARIALQVETNFNHQLGLKVIPIGLNYVQPEKFRSQILLEIGHPIEISDFSPDYQINSIQSARKLTEHFRLGLEKVLFTTQNNDQEIFVESIYQILHSKYIRQKDKGVKREVNEMKQIQQAIDELQLLNPERLKLIEAKVKSFQWKLEKINIKTDFLDRKWRSRMFFRQMMTSFIFIIIGIPLYIFGIIHNITQFQLTDWIVPKISKDIEYYAPLAILLGFIIYPLIYSFFIFFFGVELLNLSLVSCLLYFSIMPFSGLFAYWFTKYLKHISYKWQYVFLMMDRGQVLKDLQKEKQLIKKLIFEN